MNPRNEGVPSHRSVGNPGAGATRSYPIVQGTSSEPPPPRPISGRSSAPVCCRGPLTVFEILKLSHTSHRTPQFGRDDSVRPSQTSVGVRARPHFADGKESLPASVTPGIFEGPLGLIESPQSRLDVLEGGTDNRRPVCGSASISDIARDSASGDWVLASASIYRWFADE